jgi:hypothetical protein
VVPEIRLHQQNTLLLVGTCGLLEQLGSYPSRPKSAHKYRTSSSPSYLRGTCTSKIFLFKLGLLTFFVLFFLFRLDFIAQNLKGSQVTSRNKKVILRPFKMYEKHEKIVAKLPQVSKCAKRAHQVVSRGIKQQECKKIHIINKQPM